MRCFISMGLSFFFFYASSLPSGAHTDDSIHLIFEIDDLNLAEIDLHDGSVADWENVWFNDELGSVPNVLQPHADLPQAVYDPATLDYRIWLAWHRGTGRLYVAVERLDDLFLNQHEEGGDLNELARHDGVIEVMVDADHTGAEYGFDPACCTDDEWKDRQNRYAQRFAALPKVGGGLHISIDGAASWAARPPYADGGGLIESVGGATRSVVEFYVTPFGELLWDDAEKSRLSAGLGLGTIIGFDLGIPDFDESIGRYSAFHSLSGQPAARWHAKNFRDAFILPGIIEDDCPRVPVIIAAKTHCSAVEAMSWGFLKKAYRPER